MKKILIMFAFLFIGLNGNASEFVKKAINFKNEISINNEICFSQNKYKLFSQIKSVCYFWYQDNKLKNGVFKIDTITTTETM